jgi:hypothetical protein
MKVMKGKIIGSGAILLLLLCVHSNLRAQNGIYLGAESTMHNSIVWGNVDTLAAPKQVEGNGAVSHTAVQGGYTGETNIALSTSPFAGEGFLQEPYSVATGSTVNAGSSVEQATDAAGYARTWLNAVDMGAYEYQFPRSITIAAQDASKQAGQSDPELTYAISGDGVLPGDVLTVSLAREQGEIEGEYSIDTAAGIVVAKQGKLDITSMYNITFTGGKFTITAAEVTAVEKNNSLGVTLYPTITTGHLNVLGLGEAERVKVEVYNTAGALLMQQVYGAAEMFSIDLSAMPNGTLFVKLSSGGKGTTLQVVKQ